MVGWGKRGDGVKTYRNRSVHTHTDRHTHTQSDYYKHHCAYILNHTYTIQYNATCSMHEEREDIVNW